MTMVNLLEGLITRGDIAGIAATEGLILDDVERISVLETMRSIDVQACPGRGKTTLIAAKLILLAKKWPLQHQGICVLSHTNVAKDEIIDRLKRSKTIEAQRLLSYPHFIGTIQEFVGKFIAFPLIRSDGTKINLVDTDVCVNLIYSRLRQGTRNYIDQRNQYSNVLYNFDLDFANANITINVLTFPNGSTSRSFQNLRAVRSDLIANGYFFYRDVFTFARKALSQNKAVPLALRQRFPCVFLDEMQDTQKFQDELLCNIFPLGDPELIVQRFGDPDQAIFHGTGSEEPNESFNGKSADDMDIIVHKSHRFDNGLAGKVKPFSFNKIPLETELSDDALVTRSESHVDGSNFKHTIIVFNDDTCASVIQCFGEIVSSQFSDECKGSQRFLVKVVGAVGKKSDPKAEQLRIDHYWSEYDKSKSKSSFKESSLIEAVRYCRQLPSADWADSYQILINCVLRLLRMTSARDDERRYFSATSMREWLKGKGKWECFRKNIHLMLNGAHKIDQQFWEDACEALKTVFEFINIPAEATEYMAFAEEDVQVDDATEESHSIIPLSENKISHPDGFLIKLSTIHGVKGETHDATLVLETKFHEFDLSSMLPFATGEKSPTPRLGQRQKKFMHQFYVAMSRPKHLLCLAIHSDRISDAQKAALIASGWLVQELTE